MKPEWITDKVIDLAKRIHELGYRQEIQRGDWFCYEHSKRTFLCNRTPPISLDEQKDMTAFPIPDLSTCLAWLRNEVVDPCVELSVDNMWVCRITIGTDFIANCDYTPLEACYLAVIKILEDTDGNS